MKGSYAKEEEEVRGKEEGVGKPVGKMGARHRVHKGSPHCPIARRNRDVQCCQPQTFKNVKDIRLCLPAYGRGAAEGLGFFLAQRPCCSVKYEQRMFLSETLISQSWEFYNKLII